MPRNGSGTHSLTTTFVANTPALAADVNTVLGDISSSLTASLAIDGQSAMTGQLKVTDGSITAPGLAFASDLNTGFYRSASGVIRATCDGTNTVTMSASGVTITGTLTVSGATTGIIPAGLIAIWSGTVATIPTGWLLCDGTNSTPDLRDKFIIGATSDDAGAAKTNVTGALTASGGSKDAVNVSHTHTATVTDPGHDHTTDLDYTTTGGGGSSRQYYGRTGTLDIGSSGDLKPSSSETTGITVANSTEGSSGTNANLPPYYALAFIMKS